MAQAQFHGLREIANDYQKASRAEQPAYINPMVNSYSRYSRPPVDREQFQDRFSIILKIQYKLNESYYMTHEEKKSLNQEKGITFTNAEYFQYAESATRPRRKLTVLLK